MKHLLISVLLLIVMASSVGATDNCLIRFHNDVTDIPNLGANWGKLDLSRVYSSGSAYKGLFGTGWGSSLEKRLQINSDGTVVVYHWGMLKETVFHPPGYTPEIMAQRLKKSLALTASAPPPATYQTLKMDEEKRLQWYASLPTAEGKGESRYSPGTVYHYQHGSLKGELQKTQGGYLFKQGEETYHFDHAGRLSFIESSAGRNVSLTYDDSRITLTNTVGAQTTLDLDSDGHVIHINSAAGQIFYRYENGQLVESKDLEKTLSTYVYDNEGRPILFEEPGAGRHRIEYTGPGWGYKTTNLGSQYWRLVLSEQIEAPETEHARLVTIKTAVGREDHPINSRDCTYHYKRNDFGHFWLSEQSCKSDDGLLETRTFNRSEAPLTLSRNDRHSEFKYSDSGLLLRKATPDETIELEYDERFDKISKLTRIHPDGSRKTHLFRYNDAGRLEFAQGDKGEQIKLVYDHNKRITRLESVDDITLEFSYNDIGKPDVISAFGVGTIVVTYDQLGEIESVDSESGDKTALKVTRAFQRLLNIIKPAGAPFF